jgi:hypothetical protein
MKIMVIVALLLLVACSVETPITQAVTLQSTITQSVLFSPSPTQGIAPTAPMPTKYPTAFAEQKVEEYLRTNNGCVFPCFWGIIPGETSLSDAIQFFQPFGITKEHGANLDILSKVILNDVSLIAEDGIINGFEVFGEGRPKDTSSFWEVWKSYLPQNIITEYGYPDRIWFDTYKNPEMADPDRPLGYSVWFYYDDKDFLIVYSGITSKAPDYKVCLGKKTADEDFGNLSAEINVLIHTNTPLEVFANERRIYYQPSFYSDKDREMPVDVFMNMIDQDGCFLTPIESQQ